MPERTAWLTRAWRLRKAAEILLRTAQEIENRAIQDKSGEEQEPDPDPARPSEPLQDAER
jgi:hypothetical protein